MGFYKLYKKQRIEIVDQINQDIFEGIKKYLHHPGKEVCREICHGIELRGRTHPQDILPLLKELQFDKPPE